MDQNPRKRRVDERLLQRETTNGGYKSTRKENSSEQSCGRRTSIVLEKCWKRGGK